MSTLIQLLETRDDSFITSVTASSDSEELTELGQAWAISTDPWAIEQLGLYVGQAFSCHGHEALVRQLLRSGEEANNQQLMAFLFVAFDRAIRRRRINKSVERLVTGRRRGVVYSIRTLGWFRRRIWAWFQESSERDPSAYVQAACLALHQYHDDDFATGERILDNRSLMKLGFQNSPLIAIGPVHVCLTPGSSINDLTPAPWAKEIWSKPDGVRHLIELAVHSQARFIRWWAATVCCQDAIQLPNDVGRRVLLELVARDEPFQQPLYQKLLSELASTLLADDWLALVDSANSIFFETILNSLEDTAATDQMSDRVIVDICSKVTSEQPPRLIATVTGLLYQRRSRFEFSNELTSFLELALQTSGCSQLRNWLLSVCLSLARTSETAADRYVNFIVRFMITADRAAQLEIVNELLLAHSESPRLAAAIVEHCPEILSDSRAS